MASCPTEQELVGLVDGDLTEVRAAEVADHLAECADCRALLGRSEAALGYALGGIEDAAVPAYVARGNDLTSGIDEGADGDPAVAAPPASSLQPPACRSWAVWTPVAAAAVLLVAVVVATSTSEPTVAPRTEVAERDAGLQALLADARRLADAPSPGVPVQEELALAALSSAETRLSVGLAAEGAERLRQVSERFPGTVAANESLVRLAALERPR